METFGRFGAMYAELGNEDQIEQVPVELGDGILYPGEFVRELGEKKRSKWEMEEGYYLRYAGRIDDVILFTVNYETAHPLYYAFHYIDPGVLFVMSGIGSGWDVRIKHLDKFTEIKVVEQLELF